MMFLSLENHCSPPSQLEWRPSSSSRAAHTSSLAQARRPNVDLAHSLHFPSIACRFSLDPIPSPPGAVLDLQTMSIFSNTPPIRQHLPTTALPTSSVIIVDYPGPMRGISWCSLKPLRYLFSSCTRSLCVLKPSRRRRSSSCFGSESVIHSEHCQR